MENNSEWEEVECESCIVDGTEKAAARLREVDGHNQDLAQYRRNVSDQANAILKSKSLPDCGETRLWKNEGLPDPEPENPDHPRFKIISWNIERGYKVDQQIEYLKDEDPDVICLQEADWECERTDNQNIALEIAQRAGYKYVAFTTEFVEIDGDKQSFPGSKRGSKWAGRGGGVHGCAILSKYPIEGISCIKLHKVWHDWEDDANSAVRAEPRTGQRVAQKSYIKIGNKKIAIYNIHLENKNGGTTGRLAQWDQVAENAEGEQSPVVIVGDFNTLSHGAARLFPGNQKDLFTIHQKGLGKTAAEYWAKREFSRDALTPEQKQEITDAGIELRKKSFTDPHKTTDPTFKIRPVYKAKLDWTLFEDGKFKIEQNELGPWKLSDHRPLVVSAQIVSESNHLCGGIDPIGIQKIDDEEAIEDIMEGATWLDYEGGDLDELAREGGKHAGRHTYVISTIDERDVFADKYLNCTGVLLIGRDAQTGREISFVSHQDPKFFIDGGDTKVEQFAKDLRESMEEMKRRSLEGSIDAVLLGGKYDTTDTSSEVSVHYRKSIKFLGKIVHEELGFDPKVIPGAFEGYGTALDATVQTQTRKIYINRNAEHPPELEELYQASDLKAAEAKWQMATRSA